jgi:hypothetical protein
VAPQAPTIAQQPQQPQPVRRARRPARTLFEDEGAAPVRYAEDREIVPLDEQAEVPARGGARNREGFRLYEADPGNAPAKTPGNQKKKPSTDENGSLSF